MIFGKIIIDVQNTHIFLDVRRVIIYNILIFWKYKET